MTKINTTEFILYSKWAEMCDSTKIKPGGHISIDKYRPLVAIKKIAGLRLNF